MGFSFPLVGNSGQRDGVNGYTFEVDLVGNGKVFEISVCPCTCLLFVLEDGEDEEIGAGLACVIVALIDCEYTAE